MRSQDKLAMRSHWMMECRLNTGYDRGAAVFTFLVAELFFAIKFFSSFLVIDVETADSQWKTEKLLFLIPALYPRILLLGVRLVAPIEASCSQECRKRDEASSTCWKSSYVIDGCS